MKDIHEVLRQKQTKYAQLGKQIEMLQQAAEKLREVAPLLAENDDDDNTVLMEVDEAAFRRHGGEGGCWERRAPVLQGNSADGAAVAITSPHPGGELRYDSSRIADFQ